MRVGWLLLIPLLAHAVACGGVSDLVAADRDGGPTADATAPLSPTIAFTDEDGNPGVMGGRVIIGPSPNETTRTSYEIVTSDSARPIATLPSNGSASLTFDILVGKIAPKQVGVRAVRDGLASPTVWTDGDNYLHSLPFGIFYAGPKAVALDDRGRFYIFRQGIERCDGEAPCDVLPPLVEWARDATFEPISRRFVTVDQTSVKTFDADGLNVKTATFFGDLTSVALDGQGHAFVAGAGTLRCDLDAGTCQPWQFAGASVANIVVDVGRDVLLGWGPMMVRCNAAGTICTKGPLDLGREPGLDLAGERAVNGYQNEGAGLRICDLAALTCKNSKLNLEWGNVVAVTIDTKRGLIWMVYRSDTKELSLHRLSPEGQLLSSLPLPTDLAEGHLRYDPVRDVVHFINALVHQSIHAY